MEKITNESAEQMFNMCAYFAPVKIPVDIFIRGNDGLPAELKSDITDDIARNDIIRDLTRYSLLSCENDSTFLSEENRVLYMHRLLQEVVQSNFQHNPQWLKQSLSVIYEAADWDERNKASIRAFRAESPHVIAIAEKSTATFTDKVRKGKIALLYNNSTLVLKILIFLLV